MIGRLVRVTWIDAYGGGDWTPDDSTPRRPLLCESVGWVIQDDGQVLVVVPHKTAGNAHADAQSWGELVIPRGVVQSVVEVG